MASLFIKDPTTAERVERIAKRLGTTKTEAVKQAIDALEQRLGPEQESDDLVERLRAWRKANPLPAPTGLKADKAFYDWLSGEEDVEDIR